MTEAVSEARITRREQWLGAIILGLVTLGFPGALAVVFYFIAEAVN